MSTIQPTSQMIATDASSPTASSALAAGKPVAGAIHTLGLLAILAACAYLGLERANRLRAQVAPNHLFYLPSIALEWAWFAYVVWGLRMRGTSVREVLGPRWSSAKKVFIDIGIAVAFQVGALFVLAVVGRLLHAGPAIEKIRFMAPVGWLELVMWVLLSVSAGICEEMVFRGYLQRQFISWTRSAVVGVLISATIFGAGHIYQGGKQAIIIGVYGALFGALSLYRRSLKPGMIAHALQDTSSGVLISLMVKYKFGGM